MKQSKFKNISLISKKFNRTKVKQIGRIIIITLIANLLSSCTNSVNKFIVGLENRPQEPKERLYNVRQVTFPGGDSGVILAGELTYPKGKGPFLGHVLITGNNGHKPFDRDYDLGELAKHKTYLVLSDLMTKRGYAVLRYDSRGIRESTGDWTEATDPIFASDAAAALRWLRNKSGVPIIKSGYIGHSQGGIRGPLAAEIEKPDFMIILGGGIESISELMLSVALDSANELKYSKEDKETLKRHFNDVWVIMRGSKDRHEAKNKIKHYFIDEGLSSEQAETISIDFSTPIEFEGLDRDWDPIIKKYQGPILSVFGGKDKIIVADRNMVRNKAALVNSNSEVKLFPNMNHMFQPAKIGGKEYYWKIETTFDEVVVDYMDKWLQKIFLNL